tara:strand:+ start:321 stop:635 length:315 start_codon:yes stop_codon:yes gene_type:complete
MDLQQKYTEDSVFELEDLFIEKLKKFNLKTSIKIARALDFISHEQFNNDDIHTYGGVVNENGAQFFAVEFWKENPNIIVLLNVYSIESDSYLDLINLNQIIKNE